MDSTHLSPSESAPPDRLRRRPARVLLVLGIALLMLAGAWFWRARAAPSGPAALAASPTAFELNAENERDRRRTVDVSLRNTGGEDLVLGRPERSCVCTRIPDVSGTRLRPGESIRLSLEVRMPALGVVERAVVRIPTSSPATPLIEIPLTLRGAPMNAPRFARLPEVVQLVSTQPGEPARSTFRIRTFEEADSPPWVVAVKPSVPGVRVEIAGREALETLPDGSLVREYECRAEAPPGEVTAGARGSFLIDVSIAGREAAPRIGYEVIVRDPIRVVPQEVVIALSDAETTPERTILLFGEDDSRWRIAEVTTDVSWLEAVSSPLGSDEADASRWAVTLHVKPYEDPQDSRGARDATVMLSTTHSRMPELQIPVRVLR